MTDPTDHTGPDNARSAADDANRSSTEPTTAAPDLLPNLQDDLPPVEPPSARFIAQLFLVPALIVGVTVGLVFLFSASGPKARDWQTLVVNLGRDNTHRRGRAFHDLAQLLNSGQTTETGTPLQQHPPLASALAELTTRTLKQAPSPEEQADHLQQCVLLVRLLGLVDVPETTLPVLATALAPVRDVAIRQAGLQATAAAGKRALDRDASIDPSSILAHLTTILSGTEQDLRRDATVAMGIFASDSTREQLAQLLTDGDPIVRYNAAISLVRQGDMAGLSVFRGTIQAAASNKTAFNLSEPKTQAEIEEFEQRWLLLQLTLKAVGNVAGDLSSDDRSAMADLVTPLTGDEIPARIRIDAKRVLLKLQ